MTHKEFLTNKMTELGQDKNTYFLGYNVLYGHKMNGTLINVPKSQLIEMPVAENLILGTGIGMAMTGLRVIVVIERMDFLWVCADQIVNHLDKAKQLGYGNLNLIIRTCIAGDIPLDPGPQHRGDYFQTFSQLLKEVKVLSFWPDKIEGPAMICEWRKDYDADYITSRSKLPWNFPFTTLQP